MTSIERSPHLQDLASGGSLSRRQKMIYEDFLKHSISKLIQLSNEYSRISSIASGNCKLRSGRAARIYPAVWAV